MSHAMWLARTSTSRARIEDGRRHGSERTCDLHNAPATTPRTGLLAYLAVNTLTSEFAEVLEDAFGVFPVVFH